jgi:hypothetical protein
MQNEQLIMLVVIIVAVFIGYHYQTLNKNTHTSEHFISTPGIFTAKQVGVSPPATSRAMIQIPATLYGYLLGNTIAAMYMNAKLPIHNSQALTPWAINAMEDPNVKNWLNTTFVNEANGFALSTGSMRLPPMRF